MTLFSGIRELQCFTNYFAASVGKSTGGSKLVSASVMEADGMFQGFSYVPPAEDAFLWRDQVKSFFIFWTIKLQRTFAVYWAREISLSDLRLDIMVVYH